jgi:predicted RNA-binding Zn-ribbon protein involved in translation (DUF1610 family)
MNNKSISIPVTMLIKKFYCHCCGGLLIKNKRTRTIRRGDPDYKEHSRIGRTHMIGDIELTEYDFKCPDCGRITSFDEQCVIENIQKNVGKHILSQAEITEHTPKAEADLKRKRNITNIIVKIVFIALTAIIYMSLKSQ